MSFTFVTIGIIVGFGLGILSGIIHTIKGKPINEFNKSRNQQAKEFNEEWKICLNGKKV